jgi:hypothetical protein
LHDITMILIKPHNIVAGFFINGISGAFHIELQDATK